MERELGDLDACGHRDLLSVERALVGSEERLRERRIKVRIDRSRPSRTPVRTSATTRIHAADCDRPIPFRRPCTCKSTDPGQRDSTRRGRLRRSPRRRQRGAAARKRSRSAARCRRCSPPSRRTRTRESMHCSPRAGRRSRSRRPRTRRPPGIRRGCPARNPRRACTSWRAHHQPERTGRYRIRYCL
jgi:hypothetical protein